MPVSAAVIGAAPCLLALAVAYLPVYLQQGEGQVHSQLALLWYLLKPLCYEWVGLHISSLRLFSGHSFLVLTLSTDDAAPASLSSPHSLMSDARVWATCPLAVVVRVYSVFFFFSLPVMLPSEIPNSPKDPAMRGSPTVWKLLLHDSLRRMGLCP